LHWVLLSTKNAQQNVAPVVHPQTWSPFWLLKPASEHVHVHIYRWLSWSWTVLLPSDTHTNRLLPL
jgi:hypothetical protein